MRIVVRTIVVAVVGLAPLLLFSGGRAGASPPWTSGTVFIADQGLRAPPGDLWELPPGGSPTALESGSVQDVATDAAGDLFWTDCSGFVYELPAGGTEETLASGYSCPTGIAVDSAGDVFFGAFGGPDHTAGGLFKIPSGGSPELVTNSFGEIQSIAIDGNGDLWGSAGSNTLVLLPSGSTSFVDVNVPTYGGAINSVRLDDANDLYVSTSSYDEAVQLPAGGGSPIMYGSGLSYAQGVAVDGSGDVFIGQPASNPGEVVEVPFGGTQSVVATGLDYPQGLAVWPPPTPAARSTSSTILTTTNKSTVTTEKSVTVTATVSPAGGGSVQFADNGAPIGNPVAVNGSGVAQVSTKLPQGTDAITATYLGGTANAPSASNVLSFKATPIPSKTVLTTPGGTTVPGDEPISLTATVTGTGGTPTGYVEFKVNGTYATEGSLNGSGQTTVSLSLPPGTSKVTSVYEGDSIFAKSNSKTITFTTTTPYTPTVTATVTYKKRSSKTDTVTIHVKVKGVTGKGAPTGTVSADDSFTCGALTPIAGQLKSSGTCSAVVSNPTSEDVEVSYSGSSTYDPADIYVYVDVGGGD